MSANHTRMTEAIRALARQECERVLRMQNFPRYGNIVDYDQKTHRVKVAIQPDGTVTNWMNLHSPWIGMGWGFVAPPAIGTAPDYGDQVKVVFPEFGSNEGAAVSRAFDERNPVPTVAQQAQAGEAYLVSKPGNYFSLTNKDQLNIVHHNGTSIVIDGSADSGNDAVTITHHTGSKVVMDKHGNVNVTGEAAVNIQAQSIVLAGGGAAVARVGDTVQCPAGVGHITSGSTIVQSG